MAYISYMILEMHFIGQNVWIETKMSLKFVSMDLVKHVSNGLNRGLALNKRPIITRSIYVAVYTYISTRIYVKQRAPLRTSRTQCYKNVLVYRNFFESVNCFHLMTYYTRNSCMPGHFSHTLLLAGLHKAMGQLTAELGLLSSIIRCHGVTDQTKHQ